MPSLRSRTRPRGVRFASLPSDRSPERGASGGGGPCPSAEHRVPGAGGSAADAFTDVGELLAGVLDHMPHPFSHPSDHSVVVDVLTPLFMEALIHECTNPDRNRSRTSGNQEPGTGRKG